jgi:hypothetical protein
LLAQQALSTTSLALLSYSCEAPSRTVRRALTTPKLRIAKIHHPTV